MHYEIYRKKMLKTDEGPDFAQPFEMLGQDNAFQLTVETINLATGATGIEINTWGSNDLEVWHRFGTVYQLNGVDKFAPTARTAVTFRWIKLQVTCIGAGGVAVFWVNCNTSSQ